MESAAGSLSKRCWKQGSWNLGKRCWKQGTHFWQSGQALLGSKADAIGKKNRALLGSKACGSGDLDRRRWKARRCRESRQGLFENKAGAIRSKGNQFWGARLAQQEWKAGTLGI
jgi:hypothetical protein